MLTFLIEILNWMPDRVEDGYYHFTPEVHYYYDASNDSYIRSVAENSNWSGAQLETPDSRFDLDCDPWQPLEIVPDWGSKISLFSVGQEGNFNFVTRMVEPVDKFINEFYTKPDLSSGVMINDLVEQFAAYYGNHSERYWCAPGPVRGQPPAQRLE